MSITVHCECGKRFRLKDELAGKTLRCKSCGERVEIPSVSSPTQGESSQSSRSRRSQKKKQAGSQNRAALWVAGGIGGLAVLSLAIGLTFYLLSGPPDNQQTNKRNVPVADERVAPPAAQTNDTAGAAAGNATGDDEPVAATESDSQPQQPQRPLTPPNPAEYRLQIDAVYRTIRTRKAAVVSTNTPLLSVFRDGDHRKLMCLGLKWEGTADDLSSAKLSIPYTAITDRLAGFQGDSTLSKATLEIFWKDGLPRAAIADAPEWYQGDKTEIPGPDGKPRTAFSNPKDGFMKLEAAWLPRIRPKGALAAQEFEVLPAITFGVDVGSVPAPAEHTDPVDKQPGEDPQWHGFGSPVADFAVLPDGTFLLARRDGAAIHWDAAEGKELARVVVPEFAAGRPIVELAPDGARVVSASGVGFNKCGLRVWDISDGLQRPHTYSLVKADIGMLFSPRVSRRDQASILKQAFDKYEVYNVDFSPDGSMVAIGCNDGKARIYDLQLGTIVREFKQNGSAYFSADGQQLFVDANVYDVTNRTGRTTGATPSATALADAAKANGQPVRFGPYSPERLITAKHGPTHLIGHTSLDPRQPGIVCLDYSDDRRRLVTGGADGTVRVWDAEEGVELFVFRCYPESFTDLEQLTDKERRDRVRELTRYGVTRVAFLPDGERIASVDGVGGLRIWKLSAESADIQPRGRMTQLPMRISFPVGDAGFDASGQYLHFNDAVVFDLESGSLVYRNPKAITLSDDFKMVVQDDGIASVPDGDSISQFELPNTFKSDHTSGAFDASGRRYMIWNRRGANALFDVASGNIVEEFRFPTQPTVYDVNAMCILPDGDQVISSSDDEGIQLWTIESGERIDLAPKERQAPDKFVASKSGAFVAAIYSAHADVWDVQSHRKVFTVSSGRGRLGGSALEAQFTPDEQKLVVAHAARLRMFETTSGENVFEQTILPNTTAFAISPDGSRIALVQGARVEDKDQIPGGVQILELPDHLVGEPPAAQPATPPDFRPGPRLLQSVSADQNLDVAQFLKVAGSSVRVPGTHLFAMKTTDNQIAIFDVESTKSKCVLQGVQAEELVQVGSQWSRVVENRLIAATKNRQFLSWNLDDGTPAGQLEVPFVAATGSRPGPSTDSRGSNAGRSADQEAEDGLPGAVSAVAIQDDGRQAAVICVRQGPFLVNLEQLWSSEEAEPRRNRRSRQLVRAPSPNTNSRLPAISQPEVVLFSRGGDMLVVDRAGNVARVDERKMVVTNVNEGIVSSPNDFFVSPHSDRSVSFDTDGSMRVWDSRFRPIGRGSSGDGRTTTEAPEGGRRSRSERSPRNPARSSRRSGRRGDFAASVTPDLSKAILWRDGRVSIGDLTGRISKQRFPLPSTVRIYAIGFGSDDSQFYTISPAGIQTWQLSD